MNQKLKIKLVAFAVAVSGSLLGHCDAMQSELQSDARQDQGFVRLAKPNSEFTSGLSNDAVPVLDNPYGTHRLPPIVSAPNSRNSSTVGPQSYPASYPPIVAPPKTLPYPPIVRSEDSNQIPGLKKRGFSLLKPIGSTSPNSQLPTASLPETEYSSAESEAVIVEAPVDLSAETPLLTEIPLLTETPPPTETPPLLKTLPLIETNSDSKFAYGNTGSTAPSTAADAAIDAVAETSDPIAESTAETSLPESKKMVSSAGIPLYSSDVDSNEVPTVEDAPPSFVAAIPAQPESPTILPPAASEIPDTLPTLINWDHRLVTSTEQDEPAIPQAANQVYSPPSNDAPVDPSYSANPGYFAPQSAPLPAYGQANTNCGCGGIGCSNCGVGSSPNDVAGCSSCGPGGCFNPNDVASRFGDSGSIYSARSYVVIDALYFTRNDGQVVFSNFGAATKFDSSAGVRLTIGNREDSTRGREFTYLGTLPMEETFTRTDPLGRINSRILPGDGFGLAETSSFFNVVDQTVNKKTILQSLEFNRVKWGWDVLKTFYGIRYIYVEDELRVYSRNIAGEEGTFGIHSLNNLLGAHIGSELFYDVGKRMSYSLVSKIGIYANPNKTDTEMTNDGVNYLGTEKYNQTISGSIELNFNAKFRLGRRSQFRFGYTGLWLGDLTTVSDNIPTVLTPSTGIDASDSDDMFFSAFSFGLELFR